MTVRSIGTNSELISTALSVPDNGRASRDWLTFDAQIWSAAVFQSTGQTPNALADADEQCLGTISQAAFPQPPAVLKDEREDPVQSYGPPIEAATEAAHA